MHIRFSFNLDNVVRRSSPQTLSGQILLQQERFRQLPVYLAGFGLGGRLAILDACYEANPRIKGVAAIGAESDWPFPEISPKDQIGKLQAPLLMILGESDQTGNSDKIKDAGQLVEICKKRGIRAEVSVIPGVGYELDNKWLTGLDQIAAFCDQLGGK